MLSNIHPSKSKSQSNNIISNKRFTNPEYGEIVTRIIPIKIIIPSITNPIVANASMCCELVYKIFKTNYG